MGLEKAKSLLEVKNGKTFLDLIAEQVKYSRQKYGSKVDLILRKANSHNFRLIYCSNLITQCRMLVKVYVAKFRTFDKAAVSLSTDISCPILPRYDAID